MPGGRPKCTVPLIDRLMARVEKQGNGCWYWTGAVQINGYGQLTGSIWGTRYVHRWSYIHHKGAIPEGMMIRHTCDVRHCVNPAHLIPGHSVDNVHDMLQRNPDGCHRAFTPEQVQEIRTAYTSAPFPSITELAARHGVSTTAMSNLTSGKTYAYVPPTPKTL
jgi:hypothetical protein